MIPDTTRYRLVNAHSPACLLQAEAGLIEAARVRDRSPLLGDDLCRIDLEIADGQIRAIAPAGQLPPDADCAQVDLRHKLIWPCFVDLHTHLDKSHIWERTPNPDRTFAGAMEAVKKDGVAFWTAEDLYARMSFGIKCSYAHGTAAIRTHIDAFGQQARTRLEVVRQLQQEWRDRITLQAVSLVSLDYFLTPQGETLADQMAELDGGILGGVAFLNDDLDRQLDRVFELASDRHLALDFHTDETGDPNSKTLRQIADAAIRHGYNGSLVCGHCCSLAVQSPQEVQRTISRMQQTSMGVVSLPLCNMYLQDRDQESSQRWRQASASDQPLKTGQTPRWRGVTLLHELRDAGIPVAIASDNCRDPFHGFGDHDGLEVYNWSTRIAHLDTPYGDWPCTITTTPADLMGLPQQGRIGTGLAADLILFKARTFSELLSRPQSDRTVIRNGQVIDTTLPDYEELDATLFH